MNHGPLTPEIAKALLLLQDRIAAANLPSSKLDETILIATWNVRELGKRRRLKASLHFIAEVMGCFDLICLVEVRDDLRDLAEILGYLGPYWEVRFSDYIADYGGNHERVAFVYDKRAVVPTGLAGNMVANRTKVASHYVDTISWWRPPYIVSFRAGNFDFILIGAHIRWGDNEANRQHELEKLADWVAVRAQEKFVFDKDIIVAGDFNIPSASSALYKAITAKGLKAPRGILGIDHGSNLAKDKRYDQILVAPHFPDSVTGRAGVLDVFKSSFSGSTRTSRRRPTSISPSRCRTTCRSGSRVNTDDDSLKLEQIVNRTGVRYVSTRHEGPCLAGHRGRRWASAYRRRASRASARRDRREHRRRCRHQPHLHAEWRSAPGCSRTLGRHARLRSAGSGDVLLFGDLDDLRWPGPP